MENLIIEPVGEPTKIEEPIGEKKTKKRLAAEECNFEKDCNSNRFTYNFGYAIVNA